MGQQQTKDFPYEVSPEVRSTHSLWTLHNGTRKSDKQAVSVFVFEASKHAQGRIASAKESFKRQKTLRHPGVLRFMDGIELEDKIYMVTEPVVPLMEFLKANNIRSVGEEAVQLSLSNEASGGISRSKGVNLATSTSWNHGDARTMLISWGLYDLARTISFINGNCKLVHGNLNGSAIFVDKGGEFKLACFDTCVSLEDKVQASTSLCANTIPAHAMYRSPEFFKMGGNNTMIIQKVLDKAPWAIDAWGYGCIVYECFNGPLPKPESLSSTGNIPKTIVMGYRALLHSEPEQRLALDAFGNEQPNSQYPFFCNPFVTSTLFLDELSYASDKQKQEFFKKLSETVDHFPAIVCKGKYIPTLISTLEILSGRGSGGTPNSSVPNPLGSNASSNGGAASPSPQQQGTPMSSVILSPLLKLASAVLSPADYEAKIIPCVVRLFASPDRATRLQLLNQLELYHDYLKPSIVNDQIFPHVCLGFHDTSSVLREATLKSMLILTAKLSERTINTVLLKCFAKLQMDEIPNIRANTTICIAKVAEFFSEGTRERVLIPAFSRALKDTYFRSKIAGLTAFTACIDNFSPQDCASKVLPFMIPTLLDSSVQVRKQAFQSVEAFLQKIKGFADGLPEVDEPSLVNGSAQQQQQKQQQQQQQQAVQGQDISAWAGWAVSGFGSLTKKFIPSQQKPVTGTMAAAPIQSNQQQEVQHSQHSQQSNESLQSQNKQQPQQLLQSPELKQQEISVPQTRNMMSLTSTTKISGNTSSGWDMEDFESDDWSEKPSSAKASIDSKDGWGNMDDDNESGWDSFDAIPVVTEVKVKPATTKTTVISTKIDSSVSKSSKVQSKTESIQSTPNQVQLKGASGEAKPAIVQLSASSTVNSGWSDQDDDSSEWTPAPVKSNPTSPKLNTSNSPALDLDAATKQARLEERRVKNEAMRAEREKRKTLSGLGAVKRTDKAE